MNPASDSQNNRRDDRQTETPQRGAAVRAVAMHIAQLLWPALVYLGSTALDLIYAVRLALLKRSRARIPDRAKGIDAEVARLQEQKSARWSSWKALPSERRMQIRAAAAVLAVAAILGLRAYMTRGGSHSGWAVHRPTHAQALSARVPRGADASMPSSIAPAADPALLAEHFAKYRKQAAPGQWVVYGVERDEIAAANLAEVQAQLKAIEADCVAAAKKLRESNARVSAARIQRANLDRQHASQQALQEADEVIKAEQAVERADRDAFKKANDRRQALYAAQMSATTALKRVRHSGAEPVLARGDVYQWDGFKVMSPVVIKDGSHYRMWYVGCHFMEEDFTCGVGHAQSSDGIKWEKSPGPVLTIADPVVSQDLHSIAVVRTADEYLMWYAIDSNPIHGNDCATLNLATSRDGLDWKPQGLVLSANCQLPGHLWQSAFSDGKTLHLWYADYDSSDNGSLVHLVSSDAEKWQQAGATDIGTLATDLGRLWVMPDPSGYRALFTAPGIAGNFGMLHSPDGSSWVIAGDAPKLEEHAEPNKSALFASGDVGVPEAPVAIIESGGTWMWFAVPNTREGSEAIAVAFQKEAQ
jgi:hypothetical protein